MMAKKTIRHKTKVSGQDSTTILDSKLNNFRKLSRPFKKGEFVKCPVNIGDALTKQSNAKSWKLFRLYVQYLDMKIQNPNVGTFKIEHSHRSYQRVIKKLIQKGWAIRKERTVYLRAYQYVWRDIGVTRCRDRKTKVERFRYWKIPVWKFLEEKRYYLDKNSIKGYLKEIEDEIRKRISKRKLAQIRYALKDQDEKRARYSSRSAGSLFGYKSTSTGSKLRSKYFEVIEPKTEEEKFKARPRWNKAHGRYEEPTKEVAI